jgi:SAM-dependent methyltransferase
VLGTSPIYKSATLYELAILALYRHHYTARYRRIADLIPAGASVLDLCCGPARIFHRHLQHKSVRYTGLDISPQFVSSLRAKGGNAELWDLRAERPLPTADYVMMQASLYHFLPDARPILNRMIEAAREQVIISEAVRNVASSRSKLIALLAQWITAAGDGKQSHRFTEATLDRLFEPYSAEVIRSFHIAGGREKVYIIRGSARS